MRDVRTPAPLWESSTEDERVEYLSHALAYEASVLKAHVEGFGRVPKGVADAINGAIDRLRRAALGEAEAVYLHGVISSRASSSLNLVLEEDPDVAPLVRFTDRENALRLALAAEAGELAQALDYAGFPASRRRFAEAQLVRMREAAAGHYERPYAGTNSRSFRGALTDLRRDSA
ncbi:hypothetical protein [Miltoncostaea oceani]|uniref:hypothetical protein n=1 Tax=Miltoncostaea oceani TaxID=2843216 RepID=UPI001C3CE414|nr:hypothetical protein [Miltoncostaea oceani]